MNTQEDGVIQIAYAAILNRREGCGYLPQVWCNGRATGDTFAARGYDRDVAEALALQDARDLAARYVGDWEITIAPREVSA